jgi:hypothetical protein
MPKSNNVLRSYRGVDAELVYVGANVLHFYPRRINQQGSVGVFGTPFSFLEITQTKEG